MSKILKCRLCVLYICIQASKQELKQAPWSKGSQPERAITYNILLSMGKTKWTKMPQRPTIFATMIIWLTFCVTVWEEKERFKKKKQKQGKEKWEEAKSCTHSREPHRKRQALHETHPGISLHMRTADCQSQGACSVQFLKCQHFLLSCQFQFHTKHVLQA